ncbi:protein phosphatase methylesterase 1 [Dictyostelium discoideum AX4]|uniref:Probable protein phosphatase methylesterase 1 n=1 Tax=Dictyostelium discoideum TaxID=44689 RepID=PPME1_DICDI|nr:protein phosphatase methylesterase 1 [Dictyostelium discoideum AX4]Q54TN3.1 RecName: Full=Probable protein phosphatase methylesterase 1; Short=PME-1 [Dictyostelium discoideum]EAL66587.1 protein phosphatase methylesterase 1 [Dictyostelium discoideum AX4]|eukprot:XP_640558.1 protein phosphatase methylesterase 1 [Dictyostelium discoideum AX4]
MFRGIYKGSLPPIDPSSIHHGESLADQLQDKDYYSVGWNQYFDQSRDIKLPGTENTFRIYESNVDVVDNGYLFVFLHGGGYTSLSWSLVVDKIKKKNLEKKVRMMCYDCRGHGETKTSDDSNLSIETMVDDCANLINYYQDIIYKNEGGGGGNDDDDQKERLKVIIVGHSMGGSVVIKTSSTNRINNLFGLIVIDVVEGTALLALSSMKSILAKRPKSFDSVKDAIKWSISSNTVKNIESARVSLYFINNFFFFFLTDWFSGLSKEFLSSMALKLLILAGTDRLDRELTIAQMQGKFQLILLPLCGHVIQEDVPTGPKINI